MSKMNRKYRMNMTEFFCQKLDRCRILCWVLLQSSTLLSELWFPFHPLVSFELQLEYSLPCLPSQWLILLVFEMHILHLYFLIRKTITSKPTVLGAGAEDSSTSGSKTSAAGSGS